MILLLVAIGGAVGAIARYLVSGSVQSRFGHEFPWGTLTVNVTGSLLLGAMIPLLRTDAALTSGIAFLTVGVLSAFTTFSSFAYETALLLDHRRTGVAALYVVASVGAGLGALIVGFLVSGAIRSL
jgi:fluoride exporter